MGAKPAGDFSASVIHTNMLEQVFGRSVFTFGFFCFFVSLFVLFITYMVPNFPHGMPFQR